MKKMITREIAAEFFDEGHFIIIDGVEVFIDNQHPEYSLDGEWSYFLAIPLVEIEVAEDEEVSDLDISEVGVYVAYPLTEEYKNATEEERCSGDFDEWDAQYDMENPEIWKYGNRVNIGYCPIF